MNAQTTSSSPDGARGAEILAPHLSRDLFHVLEAQVTAQAGFQAMVWDSRESRPKLKRTKTTATYH
jgi:hypothetical protein